jgi:hypothetical protein
MAGKIEERKEGTGRRPGPWVSKGRLGRIVPHGPTVNRVSFLYKIDFIFSIFLLISKPFSCVKYKPVLNIFQNGFFYRWD